jgi:hypothetical protein
VVADISGSDAPFDPALLDISAVNVALANQFYVLELWERTPRTMAGNCHFCRPSPGVFQTPITGILPPAACQLRAGLCRRADKPDASQSLALVTK